jgi:hypothetical protein
MAARAALGAKPYYAGVRWVRKLDQVAHGGSGASGGLHGPGMNTQVEQRQSLCGRIHGAFRHSYCASGSFSSLAPSVCAML